MKKLIIVVNLLALFSGCKRDTITSQNACTAAKPLEEVTWLKTTKDGLKCTTVYYYSIVKAIYRGQTVFYVHFSCPTCDYVFRATLLDCLGKEVRTFSNTLAEMQAFENEVTNRQVLYACQP